MVYVRSTRLNVLRKTLIAVLGLIIILAIFYIGMSVKSKLAASEDKMEQPIKSEQSKQLRIIRANRKIDAGEAVDLTKFEIVAVPKELVPEGAVTDTAALKGKRVTDSLAKNEFLLYRDLIEAASWYEEGDRLIEHTFQNGSIPATAEVGSVIDIKLFRQGAEDPVVIAKTIIIGKTDNTLSFYLNASEQESLKEAGVEGMLFIVQYLDKAQPASAVTYFPAETDGISQGTGT